MKEQSIYITLTDKNFKKEVLESKQPVLVEFGASWCGPCHIMAPMMEQLIVDFRGQFKIGKLHVDMNGQVAEDYGIWDLPTLLFFKNGQVVDHIIGTVPKTMIAEKLTGLLSTK